MLACMFSFMKSMTFGSAGSAKTTPMNAGRIKDYAGASARCPLIQYICNHALTCAAL